MTKFFQAVLASSLICSAVLAEPGTFRFSARDIQFLETQPQPVEANEGFFNAEYDKRFELTEKSALQFHPYSYASSLTGTRQQQFVLDPRAFYLEYAPTFGWVRAGYMTMKWEGTDGLNPMDIASMKDWSDPLSTESRASAALAVGKSGDRFDFEAAYIPFQTVWLLPGVRSAWLPRRLAFPLRTDAFEVRLPNRVEYRYAPTVELDGARLHNYTTRLQYRPGFVDLALAYYEGLSDAPALQPSLDVVPIQVTPKPIFQLLSPAEITPIAYRVRTVAGFASRTFGEWIFRAATRYDQPIGNDSRVPSWSQYTVAGVERSFQVGDDTVTTLLEAAFVRAPEGPTLLSIRDVFHQTILFGLRFPHGENWLGTLSGFKSTRDSSYYAKFELGYRWSDHWRTDGTLELLDGPPESLPGVFGGNDRAMITVSAVY